ncbi:MAG: ATP-binding protein [Ignavibacteriaceae bacterium]|nr:ATP-binding protein [Ignavibacteriaceae bacterium]
MITGIVSTIPDRCKRCYSCIRECPAKAIKVLNGQAVVIPERCIVCGHCVKVCSQGAKNISSSLEFVKNEILPFTKNVSLVAPSFAASFPNHYRKIPSALRLLGFKKVVETAFGADLISDHYLNEVQKEREETIISSSCPAVCNYIEKYFPELVTHLAGIVSPMIALGRYLKEELGSDCKNVFIGPCIAKKDEFQSAEVSGVIDAVLTFPELKILFQEFAIDLSELEDGEFDPPHAETGRSYPLAGGLLKTANLCGDILEKEIIVVEGKNKVCEIIDDLSNKNINAKFIDILFCEGCISGPAVDSGLNYYSRREKVIEYINEKKNSSDKQIWKSNLYNSRNLDLRRKFYPHDERRPMPDEAMIESILTSIRKPSGKDRLNCGACGYQTCREFAITISKGLGEKEMCLPFLIEELQQAYEDLKTTEEQLHSAEKLASIGQLAAGVAHEINNPLTTIMLYASLIKKELARKEQSISHSSDLTLIVDEATRCKNIVSNLLNFARQGKLSLSTFDLCELLQNILHPLKLSEKYSVINYQLSFPENEMEIEGDKEQLQQVFLNVIVNACEAMEEAVEKTLAISLSKNSNMAIIEIRDSGCGISKENTGKIFTPFFTTKKIGRGTGLGLAITYGIIKMHKGEIHFESVPGCGTCFTLKIPLNVSYVNESSINYERKKDDYKNIIS